MLGSDRACDGGASWVLLLQERIEYSYNALYELHDLGGGQDPLISKDTLDILGTWEAA